MDINLDLLLLFPEIFLLLLSVLFLLWGFYLHDSSKLLIISRLGSLFIYALLILFVLILFVPLQSFCLLNYQYASDDFLFFFKLFFVFFSIVVFFFLVDYCYVERVYYVELCFLMGFLILSGFFLMSSSDFFLFYCALELQSLVLYTLASIKRYNGFSVESGLKYFVLGAFSSGLFLFGVSLLYGFFGITNFYDFKIFFLKWVDSHLLYALYLSLLFIVAGLLFKLAAAPFHIWAPDVYTGAPTAVVLIFAVLPKLAIFVFVVRFYLLFCYEISFFWHTLFLFTGALSVFWGTISALNQLNIKRLYAYSAIVNVGYLLITLSTNSFSGAVAAINYLIVYLVSTLALFALLLIFRQYRNSYKLRNLPDFASLMSANFLLAINFSLVFFSLAGIPPLSGFYIKFFLFKSVFFSDFILASFFFLILIFSAVSAFYYIRCVRYIFFGSSPGAVDVFLPQEIGYIKAFILVNCSTLILFFFLFQPTLYLLISFTVGRWFFV